ncbi:MAG: leucine-rich repeat domain-containing protein [Coriobacteriia bacterium]|nr:leucine-rich repeat domain-containing protein [Coriobacteriia bacterium]
MGLFGQKSEINGVRYSVGKKDAKVIKSPNAAGNISILAEVEGKPVTGIENGAFKKCKDLTGVVIPEGVKVISEISLTSGESGAFSGCINLVDVTIPASVYLIGDNAFEKCASLKEIVIPGIADTIGDYAFLNCENLESVTLAVHIRRIGDHAFSGCKKLGSMALPEGARMIGESAFSGCAQLRSITIPASVTQIDTFYDDINALAPRGALSGALSFAFTGCSPELTIIGQAGSSAEKYAKKQRINFTVAVAAS